MSSSPITIIYEDLSVENYSSWPKMQTAYPDLNIGTIKNKWYNSPKDKLLPVGEFRLSKGKINQRREK